MIDCSKCKSCYLSKICTPINSIHGNEPKIFGIDYKPGSEEQITERAWYGRTGQLGIKLLTEKFDRKELYLTYLVKCCVGLTKNKEVELCKTSWLLKEIQEVKPSWLFLFGKELAKKFLKISKVEVGQVGYYNFKDWGDIHYKYVVLNSLQKCLDSKEKFDENRGLIKNVGIY